MKKIIILLFCAMTAQAQYPSIGKIHRLDPTLDAVLDTTSMVEIIASGFTWSEGPVWVKKGNYLLFSDVPENIIHRWTAQKGIEIFLKPSGYTGTGIYSEEPGANGNIINAKGNLVSAEHGDRRISEMPLNHPEKKKTLAHTFEGKQINSPNDVVQRKNGDYFFTDPPYGLPGRGKVEPAKELDFQGVYRIDGKGNTILQTKAILRPNGLAFNPDHTIMYVGSTDGSQPNIYAFPVLPDGNLGESKILYAKSGSDGLKVDRLGNIWATGRGGNPGRSAVLIINPAGKLIGYIETGNPNSNVAFGGPKGDELFITSDMNLLRVKLKQANL